MINLKISLIVAVSISDILLTSLSVIIYLFLFINPAVLKAALVIVYFERIDVFSLKPWLSFAENLSIFSYCLKLPFLTK